MPNTAYEVAVQRQMNGMAGKLGTLTAELRIVRASLSALQRTMGADWRADYLGDLVAKIDSAIAASSLGCGRVG